MSTSRYEKHRIVIIEDEVLLALDLEMIAEDAGFRVVGQAGRMSDAIAVIDAQQPDLCLVDVHLLDGPTGIDVARHAVDNTDALVVFVTANRAALPDDLAGAYGVIAKPYTVTGMREALDHLLLVVNGAQEGSGTTPFELRQAV
jgi:two-component system, response regulator PdtaR